MSEEKGRHIVQSLQKEWNRQILLSYVLRSFAITVFLTAFVASAFHVSPLFVSLSLLFLSVIVSAFFVKKIKANDVAQFLNATLPQLEESAQLLLQPAEELNSLQKLQLQKIEGTLNKTVSLPPAIRKRLIASSAAVFVAVLFSVLLFFFPLSSFPSFSEKTVTATEIASAKPETKLAEIEEVSVTITPPAYTGKRIRKQDRFNLVAEQKAVVSWHIITTKKANELRFIFNDKSIVKLTAVNKDSTEWTGSRQVLQPGFYQLSLDKKLSELYQVDMLRDEPPSIAVQSPKENTFIKWGEPQRAKVSALVQDDYGVDSAYIQATIASGSGEAVTFKEFRLPFSGMQKGSQKLSLQKILDLPSMGLTPGDELYFYIAAKDNNRQEKRSDMFIVRLEDTAQLFSMSGLANGLDIKPELFRSERQIIIETEQLVREKDTISEAAFNKRSSNLGTDQELLRLRYGKYLGEETETEIGDHHDEEGHNNAASDFGNADKIVDEFSHKHDIAEDADFFDAPTKKQLQAMLTEMWKASLHLKTYKPKDALPFEYNALRLLKDLQQKTRVYVSKTGVKTTPLNPDKRLSGELDKIMQPTSKESVRQKEESLLFLRKAIGVLEMIQNGEALQPGNKEVLDKAATQLSKQAALQPTIFLPAYQALQRIQNNTGRKGDIALAGNGFQKMIKAVHALPQQSQTAPDMNLSKRYFRNLKEGND